MNSIRQKRVAEHIRMALSQMLLRDVRDPRLIGVTVMDVRVDRELQFADIFVNALGEEERKAEVLAGLIGATGFFRRKLAKGLRTRSTPRLHFHWDHSEAFADQMHALLDELDLGREEE